MNYFSLVTSFPKGSCLGSGLNFGDVYMLLYPKENCLKMFLMDQEDGRCLLFKYSINDRNQVLPRFSLEGVKAEDQNRMPLLWEYIALLLCAGLCIKPEQKNFFRKKMDEVALLVYKAAVDLMESRNKEGWEAASRMLHDDQRYSLNQIEMSSRLFMARKTVEVGDLIGRINSAELELEKEELLYGLVESIRIVKISDFNVLAEEIGRQRNDGSIAYAVIKLCDGKRIYVEIGKNEMIEIPGIDMGSDGLLRDYMIDLICEAVIKVSGRSAENARSTKLNSYLINIEKGEEEEGKGIYKFKAICRNSYLSNLREKGLLWPDWFVREKREEKNFYRPLSDQSRKAKKEAVSRSGAEKIYLQADPLGIIQRLPVRKIREGKEVSIAPWKRNPLREEQQRLFGDTRRLPEYYGLYVVTSFSDGSFHLRPYALAGTDEEIFSEGVLGRGERDIRGGRFQKDLRELLRGTRKIVRERLRRELEGNKISIVEQKIEVFHPIQTTYRHPLMVSLALLLGQGYKLE